MKISYGKWEEHLHLQEMTGWGYVLPNSIHPGLHGYTYSPAHAQPIPADKFKRLMRKVEEFVANSVGGNMLPAHNPKLHFGEVRDNALKLFDLYHGAKAKTEFLFVRQMLEIAAYAHDCGHRGCTLRVDHEKSKFGRSMPLPLPNHGTNVSVEYISTLILDQFLREQTEAEVSLPARLFVMGVIWATTFGHKAAKERGLSSIPDPQPKSLYFALIRVADCQPKPSFKDFIDYGARVNFGEVLATDSSPADALEFAKAQRGFLSYCLEEQAKLDRIAGKVLCAEFRRITLDHADRLDSIIAGNDPAGLKLVEDCMNRWSK